LALLPPVAHDGIPVAIGLFLVDSGDLERERLALLEHGPAVEAEAGNPQHGEVHREHIAFLAAGEIPRRMHDMIHRRAREYAGVEPRGALGVVVEPQADGVLLGCGHGCHRCLGWGIITSKRARPLHAQWGRRWSDRRAGAPSAWFDAIP